METLNRPAMQNPEKGNLRNVKNDFSEVGLPLAYFVLVFILSIPFWLVSSMLGNRLPIPINLPISALAFLNPLIAAIILSYHHDGFGGVKRLLNKAFDRKKIENKIWYLPALLMLPLIYLLSYAIMRWTSLPLPNPIQFPVVLVPVFFGVFFIGAACEELGWSGYAIDPLQDRWGALKAAMLLGVIWGLLHLIGDLQAGHTASWILWQRLYSIALRILIVWIYNNTGKSVFAAILVHTMDNVSAFLFPNYGSHYNPLLNSIITWILAANIIIGWRAKMLTRSGTVRGNVA